MSALGIGPRDLLALHGSARSAAIARGPLLVTGVLADRLARELGAGGDPSLLRTSGPPAEAVALVRVVAGASTREDEQVMRAATRASVPIVVVQTGISSVRLPYVLATEIVECPPGSGFPVEEVATVLARVLGENGPALAASLPVLRPAVTRERMGNAALAAGAVAALNRSVPHFPVLALAQTRMLTELSAASGARPPDDPRGAAEHVAPRLAAAVGTGLVARSLVRRLGLRGRAAEAAVAAGATAALAVLARAAESVRSGT